MKRNRILYVFLASLLFIFPSCGKDQAAEQQQQTTAASAPSVESQNSNAASAQSTPPQNQAETPAPDSTKAQAPTVSESREDSLASGFRMPAYWENPDAARPLAPTLAPDSVAPEAQAAYAIAQQKPELLTQMPCFCYCDRFGHKSLHDCYVTTHAEHCDVCLQEAIEADQLDKQGMSPEEIRTVIVAKHHPPSVSQ